MIALLDKLRAAALIVIVAAATASGQILLSQDFDSGSLDVNASTVVGDHVHLFGRRTWTQPGFDHAYRWVYFRADGVQGTRPTFHLPTGNFLGSYELHKFVYSPDRRTWRFFDHAALTGGTYSFSNAAPFAQNQVYVAYGLPYPVSRSMALAQEAAASPFTHATISGNGSFVIGRSAAGVDESGRAVPPLDLLAYRISDDGFLANKRKIVLVAGNHSAETPGDYALEGFVRFLLSSDRRAAGLRRSTDVYVYPQVNPAGRFAGYYRSNPENPSKDYNRFWNNPAGFTDLSRIVAAMRADTGGDVDQLFDFHAWWGPWYANNYINVVGSQATHPYFSKLRVYEPAIGVVPSSGDPGMLRIWASSPQGLNADLALTPELGFFPNADEERLMLYGRHFALALYDSIPIHVLPGDFDDDGMVNLSDLAILSDHFNLPSSGPAQGDANGDGFTNISDFAILGSYWMSGTGARGDGGAIVVPEPHSLAAWAAVAGTMSIGLRPRRRRPAPQSRR